MEMKNKPQNPKQVVHSAIDLLKWDEHDKPLIVFGVIDEDKAPFVFMAGPPQDIEEALMKLLYIVRHQKATDMPEEQTTELN